MWNQICRTPVILEKDTRKERAAPERAMEFSKDPHP
jgi:hypothetical protein